MKKLACTPAQPARASRTHLIHSQTAKPNPIPIRKRPADQALGGCVGQRHAPGGRGERRRGRRTRAGGRLRGGRARGRPLRQAAAAKNVAGGRQLHWQPPQPGGAHSAHGGVRGPVVEPRRGGVVRGLIHGGRRQRAVLEPGGVQDGGERRACVRGREGVGVGVAAAAAASTVRPRATTTATTTTTTTTTATTTTTTTDSLTSALSFSGTWASGARR